MTLDEFVKLSGSQEKAAQRLGCTTLTVGNHLREPGRKISALLKIRLRELGIEVEEEK